MPLTLRTLSVLYADDEPINQLVTAELLKGCGFEVTAAFSGREALDRLAAGAFDLVLMDIFMPEMSGIDALKAIRALDGPVSTLPVVAVTADTSRSRSTYIAMGFSGYVSKPVSLQAMLREIHTALAADRSGSRRSARPAQGPAADSRAAGP